ncbi:hypothetical protein H310_13312 [Aphanomyces invadans]|uniref:RxLR effector protein n=2 Tax=Aphanomyces invadans TaxID=157072 RepID=A0A024TE77_9STRA|nr:hypothetical protein H310_13312 [Aphanomyces invadans]ETV92435.1 hypothetical protein H310_13312 [Aphanomyces invadans]|eukprot:XP_008878986.1 hypothetical protein H310_13312 [Aphanomyces invadans]
MLKTSLLVVVGVALSVACVAHAQHDQGNLPADFDFPQPWADIDANEYMKELKERIEKFRKQREDDGNL